MMTFSRTPRGFVCLLLLTIAMTCSTALAGAEAIPGHNDTVPAQLLPPGQNPDDDGDGIADEDDPEPNNPGVAPTPPTGITSPNLDSDGDGIPNIQDPDDDNAGVSDRDDPAPFDPSIEPTPVPDHLSPIHDDDGDGIPNIQDPDDDNDGIADDEETGEPDGNAGSPGSSSGGTGGSTTPVVTRLPVTGAGDAGTSPAMTWALMALAAGLLVLRGTLLRLRHIGRR